MNNENNNNSLNGIILGSVNGTTPNNTIEPEIETLDLGGTNPSVVEQPQPQNNLVNNAYSAQVIEPTPQPAYTNPQTITNTMPGFESSNTIGTTPPISLEPEKQPQKKQSKGNKVIFIILILVALAGVGFGTYYVLNYTDLIKKSAQVQIKTKNLELNIDEELSTDINDYAEILGTDSKNCSLNTADVNTKKEGSYNYTITCGETKKTGTVKVIDNEELTVTLQPVYKTKGETLIEKEFIKDYNENYKYEFVEKDKIEDILKGTSGTYTVKIKVSKGEKNIEVEAKLTMLENGIKGYLVCTSKEQNVEDSSMTVSNRFAISNDESNTFAKIDTEVHYFKFSDETKYTNYLAEYKTNNSVTINNITGETVFDDDNLTISISNDRVYEDLVKDYGEANLISYQTIKNHFTKTLGYSCIYEKAN